MTEGASTLQDFPLQASIQAVKASVGFESYDDFHRHLIDNLPQNSPETRRRHASLIGKRYFAGRSLDTLLARVWRAYQDEQILVDLMRVTALEAEPVIARFVLQEVSPLPTGQVLSKQASRAFVQDAYGKFIRKSHQRLLLTVRRLGFLGLYSGQLVVEHIPPPDDAFLVLFHHRLAPTPRIVRVREILDADWWRLLGGKTPDAVRQVLHNAEAAGLLSRYVKVDELEQVTTWISGDEYITQARRL